MLPNKGLPKFRRNPDPRYPGALDTYKGLASDIVVDSIVVLDRHVWIVRSVVTTEDSVAFTGERYNWPGITKQAVLPKQQSVRLYKI